MWVVTKVQLISKTDWRAIDSPKKRTDEFVVFTFLLFMETIQIHPFLFWENLQRTNLIFCFIRPLQDRRHRNYGFMRLHRQLRNLNVSYLD